MSYSESMSLLQVSFAIYIRLFVHVHTSLLYLDTPQACHILRVGLFWNVHTSCFACTYVSSTGLFLHVYTSLLACTYLSFMSWHASCMSFRESRSLLQVFFFPAYICVAFDMMSCRGYSCVDMPHVFHLLNVGLFSRSFFFPHIYVSLLTWCHAVGIDVLT